MILLSQSLTSLLFFSHLQTEFINRRMRIKCRCTIWRWCLVQRYCGRLWISPSRRINWKRAPLTSWHKRAFYTASCKQGRSKHKTQKQKKTSHNCNVILGVTDSDSTEMKIQNRCQENVRWWRNEAVLHFTSFDKKNNVLSRDWRQFERCKTNHVIRCLIAELWYLET